MSTIWSTGQSDPGRGLRLKNVNISGFDKEKQWYPNCKSTEVRTWNSVNSVAADLPLCANIRCMNILSSKAIAISSDLRDKHFDYISSAQKVKIVDSRGIIMDGCQVAVEFGVKDIVITSVDGSLDPTGNATSGSLVHDYDHVKKILGVGACTSLGGCLAFCPNACLRTFSFKVEQFGTENWKLRVSTTIPVVSHSIDPSLTTIHCYRLKIPALEQSWMFLAPF